MIEFVSGDFFDYVANVRINTVNCVGIMGAGVALEFKNRYPDMFKEYVQVCKRGEISPGNPHVWEEYDLFSKCTIVNLPTKIHWKNPSEYEYIEKDLIWLHDFLLDQNEDTIVTLPALGCGHGGLKWDIVKGMISHYLGDIKARILVFEPEASNKEFAKIHFGLKLEKDNIKVIYPNDTKYPERLREKSAEELYCKGNADLLALPRISLICGNDISPREETAIHQVLEELSEKRCAYVIGVNNKKHIEFVKKLLSKGHKIILVIPYGILKVKNYFGLQEYVDNVLVVSYSKPNEEAKRYGYVVSHKFRVKMADAVLFCMDNIEEIKKLIKYSKGNRDIYYINYWRETIVEYDELAGQKIGIDSKTKRPNLMSLKKCIERVGISI